MSWRQTSQVASGARVERKPVGGSVWMIVTLGMLSAFGPVAIDMYLPAFPRIVQDLHTSMPLVQFSLSIFLIGLAVGQVFCGTLSDHLGRRWPVLIGCCMFAAAAIVCAGSRSIEALIVSRLLMGLGGSAGAVIARAVVRDLFDEHHSAQYYSLMMIIGGIAPIASPFLGGMLLAYWDWRVVFWVMAGFGLMCAIAVFVHLPETLPRERRARGHIGDVLRRYGRVLTHRQYLCHALAVGCTGGMLFAYISGSPFVFIEIFGLSPRAYSLLFAGNAVGLYAAGQVNRMLLRRFAARRILGKACVVNTAACGLLAAAALTGTGGLPVFAGVLSVCIASLALIFPNATAAAMTPFAREAGSASAMLGMLQYVLGATAGAMVGWFHNGTVLPMVLLMVASSTCALVILQVSRRWPEHRVEGGGPGGEAS